MFKIFEENFTKIVVINKSYN